MCTIELEMRLFGGFKSREFKSRFISSLTKPFIRRKNVLETGMSNMTFFLLIPEKNKIVPDSTDLPLKL